MTLNPFSLLFKKNKPRNIPTSLILVLLLDYRDTYVTVHGFVYMHG